MARFKAVQAVQISGTGDNGHGLLMESDALGNRQFTVTGIGGKRHASVAIDETALASIAAFLGAQL